MRLPFSISIAALSLVQGAIVLAPGRVPALPPRLRSRRWALVPPVSVAGFVVVATVAEHASASGLTYLALVCVPPLAALAIALLARGARPVWALLVPLLFAVAWAAPTHLAGEAAALALSALSCVALGALLAAVTPPRWLAAGIVAMAAVDTALVVSDLLQRPNNALNAAHPAAGLPRLQSALFGTAVMGYGDLFVAGLLGGLMAAAAGRAEQRGAALLTALLALCFDLLFLVVGELPATVPVAAALVVSEIVRRRRSAQPRSAPALPRRSRRRRAPLTR